MAMQCAAKGMAKNAPLAFHIDVITPSTRGLV